MATFTVHLVSTVSVSLDVEADDPSDAMDKVYDHPDMPGSITYGAFSGNDNVDHSGDWEPESVTDTSGDTVWIADDGEDD